MPAVRTRHAVQGAITVLVLVLAAVLYTRFSLDDRLSRDEAIYAYASQQWAHGVPFYTSFFDVKGPLSPALGGVAVWVASLVGGDDLTAIRLLFLAFACATAAGVHVLSARAWGSRLAGVAAAVTFISFQGFAVDAVGGPDAKTPGICLAVASMAVMLRRRWFAAALLGALAALVWQPLAVYAVLAVAAAAVGADPGARRRSALLATAGAAVPVAVTAVYYALAGSFGDLVTGLVVVPVTGVERPPETLGARLRHIAGVVHDHYGATRVLLYLGMLALPLLLAGLVARRRVAVRDPLVVGIGGSGLALALFSASDFQGYPDVFPLLPYAALGVGGLVALALRAAPTAQSQRLVASAAGLATAVLVLLTWQDYTAAGRRDRGLPAQEALAATVDRIAGPGRPIWALGDPTVLVFTHRRNPSRFIYMNNGFDTYAARHTPGGLPGFADRIIASGAPVVWVHTWEDDHRTIVTERLRPPYRRRFLGAWKLFVRPEALARARSQGIPLTRVPVVPSHLD